MVFKDKENIERKRGREFLDQRLHDERQKYIRLGKIIKHIISFPDKKVGQVCNFVNSIEKTYKARHTKPNTDIDSTYQAKQDIGLEIIKSLKSDDKINDSTYARLAAFLTEAIYRISDKKAGLSKSRNIRKVIQPADYKPDKLVQRPYSYENIPNTRESVKENLQNQLNNLIVETMTKLRLENNFKTSVILELADQNPYKINNIKVVRNKKELGLDTFLRGLDTLGIDALRGKIYILIKTNQNIFDYNPETILEVEE